VTIQEYSSSGLTKIEGEIKYFGRRLNHLVDQYD